MHENLTCPGDIERLWTSSLLTVFALGLLEESFSLAGAIGIRFSSELGRSFVSLGGYTLALFYGFTLSSVVPVFSTTERPTSSFLNLEVEDNRPPIS